MSTDSTAIYLDAGRLSSAAEAAWRDLLHGCTRALGLKPAIRPFQGIPPEDGPEFALLANSALLSPALLLRFTRLYLAPTQAPTQLHPFFFGQPGSQDQTESFSMARIKTSLVSSIYRGDEYLPGFLQNSAALHGYAELEHLLIRAASPGNEHQQLVEHVRQYPCAVYLKLNRDPGLYAVWNLGIRLANGRYLSNANIDDRRAPQQVDSLQQILDKRPEIALASSKLRISEQKKRPWQGSADCPLMFADVAEQSYAAPGLFRQTPEGLVSRNLPHCMPLWRRRLHLQVGDFEENRYGPSADWAFWLKAAQAGARYFFSAEPLGLYLRDQGTYWRRNPATPSYEQRVIQDYGHLARSTSTPASIPQAQHLPLGLTLSVALDVLRSGAMLSGIARLLHAVTESVELSPTANALIEKTLWHFLGYSDWQAWLSTYRATAAVATQPDSALFNALVDLVQNFSPQTLGAKAQDIYKKLALAAAEWETTHADGKGLLLLALLANRLGDTGKEIALLADLHAANAKAFWEQVQAVYRFSRPLPDLVAQVSEIQPGYLAARPFSRYQVIYYPACSNTYQPLLYRTLQQTGGQVMAARHPSEFLQAQPMPGIENILHFHWVSPLFGPNAQKSGRLRQEAEQFLAALRQKKHQGFKLFWTIHNNLSHECADQEAEIVFRKALYQAADRVFIHHPLAAELLDWLPDRRKLHLCEHGAYDLHQSHPSKAEARKALGYGQDERILTYMGAIRGYKGLAETLPLLWSLLQQNPKLSLVVAGRVQSNEVADWLKTHQHPRLRVRNTFLSDQALEQEMAAADLGLLTYSASLTSGSLVHWFSLGRPVLAPTLGTIPAYLVDGWNGYSYPNGDALQQQIQALIQTPTSELNRLGQNARRTAQQMAWRLWEG